MRSQWLRSGARVGLVTAALACASPPTEYRGMVVHHADATTLEDCASGVRYPVPMEADHRALERAVLAARSAPAAPVWVRVEGRLEERAPEPGMPPREHLVVERVLEVRPGDTCDGPRPEGVTLFETRWELLALDEDLVDAEATPHLQLSLADHKAYGFSGCNRFFGTFEHDGDGSLKFGPIAVTRMACPPPKSDLEIAFLRAMQEVAAYRLEDGTLHLLDEDEVTLLQFQPATATLRPPAD